ncbi:MAG: thioesterase domain-containing protein, partial [Anaerolineae bacterium]
LDTLVPPNTTLRVFRPPNIADSEASGVTGVGRQQLYRLFYYLRRRLTVQMFSLREAWLARKGSGPPSLLGRQAQHIRATANAHFRARLHYVPKVYPGRLTLFANAEHTGGRQLNWADLTTAGVDIYVVPGNHRTMFREPNVQVMAEQLRNRRDQALAQVADHGYSDQIPLASQASVRGLPTEHNPVSAGRPAWAPREVSGLLEEQIAQAWQAVFGASPAFGEESLFDVGVPAMSAVYLLDELERRTGRRFSVASLVRAPTVAGLAELLRNGQSALDEGSLTALRPHGSRIPFYLVPDIDRTVLSLVELVQLLNPNQPTCGFQPLGLVAGQAPHTTVEQMAAAYVREMRAVQPQGPYLLGGVGFGAIVAFEMAQQLRRSREGVPFLAVLDTMVPPNATWQYWYPPASAGVQGSPPQRPSQRVVGRAVYLWQRYQLQQVTPRRAQARMPWRRRMAPRHRQVSSRIRAMLDAHLEARLRYQPQVYPGPITLFSNSEHTGPHQVKWALLTDVGMEIEVIPGNHRSIFRQPHVKELAARLDLSLALAGER